MNTMAHYLCVLLVAAIALTSGCGGDSASGAGESCEQTSDCATGLTCLGGVCQKPSATTDAGGVSGKDAGHPDAGKDAGHPLDGAVDAGTDAGGDAGHDVGLDSGTDAAIDDAGTDAAIDDAGTDAAIDDAGTDATIDDAGTDAAIDDAGTDAAIDDAGIDAAIDDAGTDAGTTDAGVDGGTVLVTTIAACPPASHNVSAETFQFSSSDPGALFECALDSGAWAACTSPVVAGSLGDGAHTFAVRAVVGGVPDPNPAQCVWLTDTVAPSTTINSGPAVACNIAGGTFTFSGNETGCAFTCALDGAPWAACTSPAALTGLADGSHTFSARCTDLAGNVDASPPQVAWVVDTLAPQTTVDSGPSNPSGFTDADVSFSAGEPNSTFECRLDAGAWAACTSSRHLTGLAEGNHAFDVRATDQCGNVDPTPASLSWLVNLGPVDTRIDTQPPALTNATAATFTFSCNKAGCTFTCSLDSAAPSSCTSPASYAGLPGGNHTFEAAATDGVGNVDLSPAQYGWAIDVTAPATALTGTPADPSGNDTATFVFTCDELATSECRIDSAAFAACTSPQTYTGLSDGPHTFDARCTDIAGNVDPTDASYSWTVDTGAPGTTITSAPPLHTNQPDATVAFSSDDPAATFECRLDGGAWASCISPKSLPGLADGTHLFEARATDAAGNVDQSPTSATWTVDTVPPDTTITGGPAALSRDTAPSFDFTADEPVQGFECRIDGGAWAACTSPKGCAGLSDGDHTFEARAIDLAGSTDPSPASSTWTIDATAPSTMITGGPADPSPSAAPSFTISCSETALGFECRLDGGSWAPCTSPQAYAGLADGSHVFAVRCTDLAGNTDPAGGTATWTIDTLPPVTTISSAPAAITNDTGATLTFSADEPVTGFECRLDGGAWGACSSPKVYAGLADGAHSFSVRATDLAGNVEPSPPSAGWTVDTAEPDTTITGNPPALSNSTAPSFTFTSTEAGSTFECRIDGGAWAACTSPAALSGLTSTAHVFDVRATDPAGNTDSTPASYTWTVDAIAPDTTITANPSDPTTFTSASFSFTCDEAGSTECSLDGVPYSVCTSPASYAGLADGVHTFAARCVDLAGNTDPSPASFSWRVDTTPPDTTISAGPPTPTNATGATFSFSCTETSTIECRLDAGAWGACTSPASYAGLADLLHVFSARCTDAAGLVDPSPAVYTWTVDTIAPNTSIVTGPPSLTNNPGASFTFSATEGGSMFECQLDGGAWGACASPQAYGPLADGNHQFCVRATDPAANTDQTPACASWQIDTMAPDTLLLSWPADPTKLTAASFTFDTTETGGSFQCQLDAGGWSGCTSPAAYAGLSSSSHTFQVRAVDQAGNTDLTPASYTWTVDTTPPSSSITSKPADPTNQQTAIFAFTSDDAGASYECNLDAAGWTPCVSPATYNGLAAGGHTFAVRGTDALGNVETAYPSYAWTIDLAAPDTTLTGVPPDPNNSATPTFTFTSTEPGSTFECRVDAAAWAACTSPHTTAALADGSRTFDVRATDPAGNTDPTPASYTWRVDLTPPDTQLTGTPASYTALVDATFDFSSTESPATFECRLDAGAWGACTTPKTYLSLGDGAHAFDVRATDQAGNTDLTPATFSWTIDTVNPDTSIDSKPPSITNLTTALFTFSCSGEAQPCTFECSLDIGGYSLCTTPVTLSGLANGSHTYRVRAKDAAANTDATPATWTWTVDTIAPSALIDSTPGNPSLVTDATFTFHCSEVGTNECQLDAGGWASCTSPKVYNGLAETSHTFQVRCTDQAGNTSTPTGYSWDITIWSSEVADGGRFFTNFHHRAIATDQNDYAHIVYGGANLYHAWYNGSIWSFETLDTSRGVGQYAALAFDSSWKMHVAYYDEVNADLLYMTNASGSWQKANVDSAISAGQFLDLAVDAGGRAHISYYDASALDLKYATNASGVWVRTTVDSIGTVGQYSSIALDGSGYAHVSYYDSSNTDLKYATNAPAGAWSTVTVDGAGVTVGSFSSIALDASGYAHVAYYDGTLGDLKYATNASGSWVATTADPSANVVGQYASILVDPSGFAHVSYYDGSTGDLKFATNASGVWVRVTIDSTGTVGLYTSIARDAAGRLHVSYYDASNFKLKYAVKSGSWVAFALDTAVHVGQWTSLSIDTGNAMHACYYDVLNGDLRYATKPSGGSWSASAIDTFGTVGQYGHIGVDSNKKPRISYYDASGGDLKYADNTFGPWAPMTIDNPNVVGQYTGLAVDKNDKVHVAYYDATNGDLRYASDESGGWATAILDSANNVGQFASIAADSGAWSHVAYYDTTNGDLRYTTNVGGSWAAPSVIDNGGGAPIVGQWTAIAVDGSDHLHVAYYNASAADLKYAYYNGTSWTVSTIESVGNVGQTTSIAADALGNAHLSYYDGTNLDLKYATNKYGAWQTFSVDSAGWVGQYTGIALDTSGKPHVTYYDASMRALRHATNSH